MPCPLRRDPCLAAIPDGVVIIMVFDARELRFRAERHGDAAVELALAQAAVDAAVALVDFKTPFAVEAEPVLADELRARVLITRDIAHIVLPKGSINAVRNHQIRELICNMKEGEPRSSPSSYYTLAGVGKIARQHTTRYYPKNAKSSRRVCASPKACSGDFSPMKAADNSSSITASKAVFQLERGWIIALGTNSAYSLRCG